MALKSNIKSKKFYADAEDMQEGWGEYLRYIDTLKDKKQDNARFCLNDFCWTLYGDGHCSNVWEGFKQYANRAGYNCRTYESWTELFNGWIKTQ
jgi:hypothetical protein